MPLTTEVNSCSRERLWRACVDVGCQDRQVMYGCARCELWYMICGYRYCRIWVRISQRDIGIRLKNLVDICMGQVIRDMCFTGYSILNDLFEHKKSSGYGSVSKELIGCSTKALWPGFIRKCARNSYEKDGFIECSQRTDISRHSESVGPM